MPIDADDYPLIRELAREVAHKEARTVYAITGVAVAVAIGIVTALFSLGIITVPKPEVDYKKVASAVLENKDFKALQEKVKVTSAPNFDSEEFRKKVTGLVDTLLESPISPWRKDLSKFKDSVLSEFRAVTIFPESDIRPLNGGGPFQGYGAFQLSESIPDQEVLRLARGVVLKVLVTRPSQPNGWTENTTACAGSSTTPSSHHPKFLNGVTNMVPIGGGNGDVIGATIFCPLYNEAGHKKFALQALVKDRDRIFRSENATMHASIVGWYR